MRNIKKRLDKLKKKAAQSQDGQPTPVPGGIICGTPEEIEAQMREIEERLVSEYGFVPRGTIIISLRERIRIED